MIRVGLAALECAVGDVAANTRTAVRTVREYADFDVDLMVFPEAFLQGFDAFTGDVEHDRAIALTPDVEAIERLRRIARSTRTAVCMGFLERDADELHSSALVIGKDGRDLALYRRMSPGWRVPDWDTSVYTDGVAPEVFTIADKRCTVALCGDLFTMPERFSAVDPQVVLWPLHRELDVAGWAGGELDAYAAQANEVYASVVMANDVSGESVGGAAWFRNGKVKASQGFDGSATTTLVVDLR